MSARMRAFGILLVLVAWLAFLAPSAYADVPRFVTWSGRLTDGTGWGQSAVLPLRVSLWDAATGGTGLWQQAFDTVAVEDGYFSALLGDGTVPGTGAPLNVTDVFRTHPATWITVAAGTGPDLEPRQPVGSVPYAASAQFLGGRDAAGYIFNQTGTPQAGGIHVDGTVKAAAFVGDGSGLTALPALPAGSGNYIQNQVATPQVGAGFSIGGNALVGGNVGIGTTNPEAKLSIVRNDLNTDNVLLELGKNAPLGSYTSTSWAKFWGTQTGGATDRTWVIGNTGSSGFQMVYLGNRSTLPSSGLNVLTLGEDGNVGIGTAVPEYNVHVRGLSSQAWPGIRIDGGRTGAFSATMVDLRPSTSPDKVLLLEAYNNQSANHALFGQPGTTEFAQLRTDLPLGIGTIGATGLYLGTNSKNVLTLSADGKVGIGTTSPRGNLEVVGNSIIAHKANGAEVFIDVDNVDDSGGRWGSLAFRGLRADSTRPLGTQLYSYYWRGTDTGKFYIDTRSGGVQDVRFCIVDQGYVGIGTNKPSQKLEVAGTVKATAFVGDGSGLTALPAGSGNYIQNQVAAVQAGAGFNIGGDALVGGKVRIGTATPGAMLDILGTSGGNGDRIRWSSSKGRYDAIGVYNGNEMFVQPNTYLRILRGYSYTYGDRKMASEDTAFLIDSKSIGMALDKGFVGIGTSTPSVKLDVDGAPGEALLRLRVSKTPTSSADSSGDVGSFAWDDNYVYVKTSKGWRRAALGAW